MKMRRTDQYNRLIALKNKPIKLVEPKKPLVPAPRRPKKNHQFHYQERKYMEMKTVDFDEFIAELKEMEINEVNYMEEIYFQETLQDMIVHEFFQLQEQEEIAEADRIENFQIENWFEDQEDEIFMEQNADMYKPINTLQNGNVQYILNGQIMMNI